MTERESRQRRFAELMDRQAVGEALSPDELAFCERMAREDATCRRETEFLDQLAEELDAAPDAASRALVDATLARLEAEAVEAENQTVSQLRGPRVPRFVWALAAAAAVALVVTFALLPQRQTASLPVPPTLPTTAPRVELVYAAGDVRVDGKAIDASAIPLAEGSRITVENGSACVAMDPDIDICLDANTQVVLSRMQSPWRRVDLLQGKVGVQLSPQPEGYRLSIVADEVWSTAVGTAFTVERSAPADVRTAVLNGKVRVGSDEGDEQLVTAHQRTHVKNGQAALHAISRNDEAPEWALLRPARLWSNPVTGTLEVHGLQPGTDVVLDGQMIGKAPLCSLIPAGAHLLEARSGSVVLASREFVSEAGQLTALSFALEPAGAAELAVDAPAPARVVKRARGGALHSEAAADEATTQSAATLLNEARRLMRSERYEEAAERYQALREAYPESPEAHTVLLSLAELQLDRLDQPQKALNGLNTYLKAGRGSLTEEARQVRIRALRALGHRELESDAIAEFLHEHPRSFKAAALAQRLQELRQGP